MRLAGPQILVYAARVLTGLLARWNDHRAVLDATDFLDQLTVSTDGGTAPVMMRTAWPGLMSPAY
ncbi:MAG: hypothetical protein IPH26_22980 [Sterolibacteriaceae bacterium]|uniref:Uncharacterized protein n=1 Tax=Candidatus Methylophosphatis roskildensis TaxID=2899263 RepID=A0A9D7EA94_9PROT|nr:hypothetical protein [Candidatus Methylophosphatis roskildensis]